MFFCKSKSTNTQIFYNFLSTVIISGITFITMPIFTRLLGAEQFGFYSIYMSWLTILVCIMGLNVKAGLGTGYYKFQSDYFAFRSSTLIEGTIISIIIIGTLLGLYILMRNIIHYSAIPFILLIFEAFAQYILNFANLS